MNELTDEPVNASAPDPGATTTPEPSNEWDFLDKGEELPNDPMEFRDELEDREAAGEAGEGEAGEAEGDGENDPVAQDDPVDAPEDDAQAPELAELQKKAEEFEYFDNLLRQNPAALITAVMETLNVQERASILQQLGAAPAEPSAFDVSVYEPQGEMEAALAQRWQDIAAIPELAKEQQAIARRMDEQVSNLTPHISNANVQAEINAAKIDAICEALGISLDDPDINAVAKELGSKGYRDAVRSAVNYKKQVEAAKQRTAPRPKTPGNESRREEKFSEGTDMLTIARRMGALNR